MTGEVAPILEVCCASADFALAAEAAGADRIELCANLVEGGTTPSAGAVEVALERLGIPVMTMVRPRGGDFLYSGTEVDVMLRDTAAHVAAGVAGVVIGALGSSPSSSSRRRARPPSPSTGPSTCRGIWRRVSTRSSSSASTGSSRRRAARAPWAIFPPSSASSAAPATG